MDTTNLDRGLQSEAVKHTEEKMGKDCCFFLVFMVPCIM